MHRVQRLSLIAALLVMAAPGLALAHAKMTTSVPVDGAVVPAPLSEIALSFSEAVRLTVVRVTNATEQTQIPLSGGLPKTAVTSARVKVGALPAGAYEVSWTAVADDGHVMTGAFKFTVGAAQQAKPAQ